MNNNQDLQKEVPVKGQRVLLRGFESKQEAEARALLTRHGYHVASSIALTDIVLLGGANASSAVEAARKAGITVTAWAEFSARMSPTAQPVAAMHTPVSVPVEFRQGSVRILDQVLPCVRSNSPLVPSAHSFRHLCLDTSLLRNARAVALGARNGFPVALEGDTSASKTTAVLWVAYLIGQPVVRLNLHGQSDSSEIVGRYVPGVANPGSQPHFIAGACGSDRFNPGPSGLHAGTRWNRTGTIPCEKERTTPSWVFKEGCVPRAMRHGWWVLFDEMNLAEPQALERLNSVLEQPPSLVLSEGDGTLFGSGGQPIAPGFRVFATMNPAEYAGRSVLSPAFRDRWLVWHQAEVPGESGFAAMLRCLVFGEQPEITFRGRLYQSPPTQPVYPALAGVSGIRDLLPRLAMFHASLCQASGMGGSAAALGRTRRERYVFTRRSLLTCMQLLESAVTDNPGASLEAHLQEAIEIAYLGRLHDGADRNAAVALLRAAGLTPS